MTSYTYETLREAISKASGYDGWCELAADIVVEHECQNCAFYDGSMCKRRSHSWPSRHPDDWCGEWRASSQVEKLIRDFAEQTIFAAECIIDRGRK